MAFKIKRPSAGMSRGSREATFVSEKMRSAGVVLAKKTSPKQRRVAEAETIEARLARKARVADTTTFMTESLGQMTREKRHKLLYGD